MKPFHRAPLLAALALLVGALLAALAVAPASGSQEAVEALPGAVTIGQCLDAGDARGDAEAGLEATAMKVRLWMQWWDRLFADHKNAPGLGAAEVQLAQAITDKSPSVGAEDIALKVLDQPTPTRTDTITVPGGWPGVVFGPGNKVTLPATLEALGNGTAPYLVVTLKGPFGPEKQKIYDYPFAQRSLVNAIELGKQLADHLQVVVDRWTTFLNANCKQLMNGKWVPKGAPPSACILIGGHVPHDLAAVAAQPSRRCGITARGAEADGFLVPANSWCELTAGGPEDELQVTATGLEPGTAYDLTLGGRDGGYAPDVAIGSFTTDASGGFEGLFTLPAIAGRDAWTLTARPAAGGGQAVSTALTTDEVYCLYFNIAPGSGSVEVHWTGVGFRPDSSFTLLLDGRRIATDRSDANGTLETLSGSVACPPGQVDTFTSEGPFLDGPGQPEVTRLDCDTGQTNKLG